MNGTEQRSERGGGGRRVLAYGRGDASHSPFRLAWRGLRTLARLTMRPLAALAGAYCLFFYLFVDAWGGAYWLASSMAAILCGTVVANAGAARYATRPSTRPFALYSGILILSLRPGLDWVAMAVNEGPRLIWFDICNLSSWGCREWLALLPAALISLLILATILADRPRGMD